MLNKGREYKKPVIELKGSVVSAMSMACSNGARSHCLRS